MNQARRQSISKERIERCAAIYHSNKDAALALGIGASEFAKLCRKYEVEQPARRRKRIDSYIKGQ